MTVRVLQYTQKALKNYFKKMLTEACEGRDHPHIFLNSFMQPLENTLHQEMHPAPTVSEPTLLDNTLYSDAECSSPPGRNVRLLKSQGCARP